MSEISELQSDEQFHNYWWINGVSKLVFYTQPTSAVISGRPQLMETDSSGTENEKQVTLMSYSWVNSSTTNRNKYSTHYGNRKQWCQRTEVSGTFPQPHTTVFRTCWQNANKSGSGHLINTWDTQLSHTCYAHNLRIHALLHNTVCD